MKIKIIVFVLFLALISSVYLFRDSLFNIAAKNLVHEDVLELAEAIVVLSGSKSGNRLESGAQLLKDGFGKALYFSGFQVYPRRFTNQLMIEHAKSLGIPSEKIFTQISNEQASTWGEGIANLNLLKQNGVHKFILVTSSFHTKRSRWVYKKLIDEMNLEMEFKVYPAKDPDVPIEGSWKLRAGRKMILLEYLKTIAYYIEH